MNEYLRALKKLGKWRLRLNEHDKTPASSDPIADALYALTGSTPDGNHAVYLAYNRIQKAMTAEQSVDEFSSEDLPNDENIRFFNAGYNRAIDTSKVDRFEVIDETGRAYVKGSIYGSPVKIELDYQDDGRTLKVFVREVKG